MTAEIGEGEPRLNAEEHVASRVGAETENAVHLREVDDDAAIGYGTCRDPGT